MKNHLLHFFFCLSFLLIVSCKDDEATELSPTIVDLSLSEQISENESMEIEMTLQKPTPCHYVDEVKLQVTEKTYDYDIILEKEEGVCAQVITEETVSVFFEPQESGAYTLNFLINGMFYESRQVRVGE